MKTQPMNLNQDQEVKLPPFDVTYSDTQSYITYLNKIKQDLQSVYDVKKLELILHDKTFTI